jgi:hypothetical protein
MATQYNADDTPFSSKQDMMEYDLAMSGKVSGNMLHGVECDPAQLSGSPGKYTRAGPVQQGEDIKTYDHGVLNIATSNTPAQFNNTSLGELWVSYTVQLRKPKFYVARGLAVQRDCVLGSQLSIPINGGWYGGQVPGWSNIQLAVGQQDRIGGLTQTYTGSLANQPAAGGVGIPPLATPPWTVGPPVDSAATQGVRGAWTYTFPATFSGNVKVRFTAFMTRNVDDPAQIPLELGASINVDNVTQFITPINDIYSATQWGNAIYGYPYDTGTGGTVSDERAQQQLFTEAHYKIVSPPTGGSGTDNILWFVLYGGGAGNVGTYATVNDIQIDVEVYNCDFNYAKSQEVIALDPGTLQTITWPPPGGS